MRHVSAAVAIMGVILVTGHARAEVEGAHASPPQRPAHFTLSDAAPSADALIDRLLDALAKNDIDALQRLRVTEDEYRRFLLPGGGEPGRPARVYDDETSTFAWQMLNTKSTYAADDIVKARGGRKYKVKEVTYLKGRKDYAWYTAYRTVGLKLEDETGQENELVLGSIAEVDGQFKFVSFYGDR